MQARSTRRQALHRLSLLAAWAAPVRAQAPSDRPAAGAGETGPVIRYGGAADVAPFESLDGQGRPQGFQVELLAALAPLLGARIEVVLQPWDRTEADFRAGRLDLIAMVATAERRRWAQFLPGHATPALAVYHRRERAEPQDLQALDGWRLAHLDSASMREAHRTWLSGLSGPFQAYDSAALALAAVQRGDADAALLPRAYADRLLAEGQASGVVASAMSLRLQSYAFATAPGQADLQRRLQAALDTLEHDGRLEALRLQWLSSHREAAEREHLGQLIGRWQGAIWVLAGGGTVALSGLGWLAAARGRRMQAEGRRRRAAEQALAEAEALLARSFTQHPEPMLVIDRADGRVRDANAALLALLGVPADHLIGQPLSAQGQHVEAHALAQLVRTLATEGVLDAAPLPIRRADGSVRECLVSADTMRVGGADQLFCIVRDITEQLARDAALRAGYEALAAVLQAELTQARLALDDAQQGLVRAEGALQAFTRTVAHDLRTPLNAISGFIGLLRQRLLDGHVQEALGYSQHIERAAQRMNAMITALAALARVDQRPLQRRRVDMQQQAQDTVALLAAARPAPAVDCRIAALPPTEADPDLAAQVWQNLLDNAWKYSAQVPTPRVAVDSFRDARGTWYRVADNGAGFDMARAGRLFQPFQRMHRADQFAGSGVGLSLVKRIVDHHGGEIRLRSAPDVGTVAEFTLDPAPQPPAAAAP